MRCSTIITCELLNYTVQRQATQSKSTIKQAQSVANKQDKLVRNSKHVKKKHCHSSGQYCVHHNTGCSKESKQSIVTREAGKSVNIVTLEPDRLDVCGPN